MDAVVVVTGRRERVGGAGVTRQADDPAWPHCALQRQQLAGRDVGDRARAGGIGSARDRDAVDGRDIDRVTGGCLREVGRDGGGFIPTPQ